MERFWSKVNKGTDNGCWEWQSVRTEFGYGLFRLNGKNVRAHRLSWEMVHGPIPKGLVVCHKCDNPSCVNPDHLFLGTKKDNAHDRMAKGRPGSPGPKSPLLGEKHQNTTLTNEQVLEIRSLHRKITQRKIAEMFNITFQSVHNIVNGKRWSHI